MRNRAKELIALVKNENRVLEEREKAKINKAKFTGVSREGLRHSYNNDIQNWYLTLFQY